MFPQSDLLFSVPKQGYWAFDNSTLSLTASFSYSVSCIKSGSHPHLFDSKFCCLRNRSCCHWTEKEKTMNMQQDRKERCETWSLVCYTHCQQSRWDRGESPSQICNLLHISCLCEREAASNGSASGKPDSLARAAAFCRALLKATPCSSQVWNIPQLSSFQHHTAPFPPPALLPSHHCHLLSYSVHLQLCCFLSYRRVKELAIYRAHLLSSPFLQQQKQFCLGRQSSIISSLPDQLLFFQFDAFLESPSIRVSLKACRKLNNSPFVF